MYYTLGVVHMCSFVAMIAFCVLNVFFIYHKYLHEYVITNSSINFTPLLVQMLNSLTAETVGSFGSRVKVLLEGIYYSCWIILPYMYQYIVDTVELFSVNMTGTAIFVSLELIASCHQN